MRVACALVALFCVGCASEQSLASRPLYPRQPITTEGGAQLEADPDGRILWRPSQDDLDASLGVALETDPDGGVRVVGLLAAETPLEVDDVIRAVRARPSPRPARVLAGADKDIASSVWTQGAGHRPAPAPVAVEAPPAIDEVRAHGHAVRGLDDLRGYALCPCRLELVVRRAGRELALRVELAAGRPLEAPPWAPSRTRELGFEAVRVGDLPHALRPNQMIGDDDDLLVTFVGEGSTIALRGLRPLDVIPAGVRELTRAWRWETPYPTAAVLRPRGGRHVSVDFTPAPTVEEWSFFPPLFRATRSIPTHLDASSGLVVADLVRLDERWSYEVRTDRYQRRLQLRVADALFLSLLRVDIEDGDGAADQTGVALGPFKLQLQAEDE